MIDAAENVSRTFCRAPMGTGMHFERARGTSAGTAMQFEKCQKTRWYTGCMGMVFKRSYRDRKTGERRFTENFYIKYYVDGKPIREATGSADRDFAQLLLNNRTQKVAPQDARLAIKNAITNLSTTEASTQCTVGATAELICSADLLNRGYEVYKSVSHNSSCDLIAMKDGRLLRIEVKAVNQGSKPSVDRSKSEHVAMVVRGFGIVYSPSLECA